mgnify:FL=1
MVKFLIFVVIGYLVLRATSRWFLAGWPSNRDHELIDDEMVKDPVCEMYVPRQEALSLHHSGDIHYFCSETCRKAFKEHLTEGEDANHNPQGPDERP